MIHGTPVMTDTRSDRLQKSQSFKELRASMGRSAPQSATPAMSSSQSATDLGVPSWIAHQGEVLCFHSYFKEAMHERENENFRVRKVKIMFYREDGSISCTEAKFQNSGMPQGAFMHRHKVPKNESEYIQWTDLQVGGSITMYGRTLQIVSCDAFTRSYAEKNGYLQAPDQEFPEDPFEGIRTQFMKIETGADETVYRGTMMNPMKEFMEASLGKHIRDGEELKSFLENDRKVLRFYCVWDSADIFGGRGHFTMHYYLTDGTVEFKEDHVVNSGKDPFPKLLCRAPLPLDHRDAVVPLGSSKTTSKDGFLSWDRLCVGEFINVYSRQLQVVGCDAFTRAWFEEQGAPQPANIPEPEPVQPVSAVKIPPHNGIGSEEDSRQSCLHLQVKPVRRDIEKLLRNDRKTIQFAARFVNPCPTDVTRRFTISIFLADDTLGVFEPALKNSGILGGRFLARGKYKKAGMGGYFKPKDFYVGAEVTLNKFLLKIYDVDAHSLKLMEAECAQFPMSDKSLVMGKITGRLGSSPDATAAALQGLAQGSGEVPLSSLREYLRNSFADFDLTDQEIITALRTLDPAQAGSVPLQGALDGLLGFAGYGDASSTANQQGQALAAASAKVLKDFKRAFLNQEGMLTQTFRMKDASFSGVLSMATFRSTLSLASQAVGYELTPSDALLLSGCFYPSECESVDYRQFLEELWA